MGSDGYVGGYISSQYHLDTYAQKNTGLRCSTLSDHCMGIEVMRVGSLTKVSNSDITSVTEQ